MPHFIYCYAECHYAECQILFIVLLNAIVLSVGMLFVVMLSVAFYICYAERRYAECYGSGHLFYLSTINRVIGRMFVNLYFSLLAAKLALCGYKLKAEKMTSFGQSYQQFTTVIYNCNSGCFEFGDRGSLFCYGRTLFIALATGLCTIKRFNAVKYSLM